MALNNLPQDFLYKRIPAGVLTEDARLLLRAVVEAYQDRVAELRTLAGQIQDIWTPDNSIGEPYPVVVVSYSDDDGEKRSLTLNATTAPEIDDQLLVWCATEAGIDREQIISATRTTDLARTAENRTLALLADTIGAKLYTGLAAGDGLFANQKRALKSYFARLRVKGTPLSFELLGRLHGFSDSSVTPLWSRLSPRKPSNIGDATNDQDFSTTPQGFQSPGTSSLYDPSNLSDGVIYTWQSPPLGIVAGQTGYAPDNVGGFNPYVDIAATKVELTLPASGVFFLAGGAEGKAASLTLLDDSGTDCGLKITAIAAGSSFNGAQIAINAGADTFTLSVYHNLSAIKYRASCFNFAACASHDSYASNRTIAAPVSADMSAEPSYWLQRQNLLPAGSVPFKNGGVGIAPYRFWTGGSKPQPVVSTWPTVLLTPGAGSPTERDQATSTTAALDLTDLAAAGRELLSNIDDVRPATRTIRRYAYGLSVETEYAYAPVVGKKTLAAIAATGSASGNAGTAGVDYPAGLYTAVFEVAIHATVSTRVSPQNAWTVLETLDRTEPVAAETVPSQVAVALNFSYGPDPDLLSFTGTYDPTTTAYYFAIDKCGYETDTRKVAVTATIVARWSPVADNIIRQEPLSEATYQPRPEDAIELTYQYGLDDEYPWQRQITAGGEASTSSGQQLLATAQVVDETGTRYDVVNVVSSIIDRGYPILQLATTDGQRAVGQTADNPIPTPAGQDLNAGPLAVASTSEDIYTIGAVRGVLVADARVHWTPAHYENLALWLRCDEHPLQPYQVKDRSDFALTRDELESGAFVGSYTGESRVWDSNRGWVLTLAGGADPQHFKLIKRRFLGLNFAVSLWAKITPGLAAFSDKTVLSYGPLKVNLSAALTSGGTQHYLTAYAQNANGTYAPIGLPQAVSTTEFTCMTVAATELTPPRAVRADACSVVDTVRLGLTKVGGVDLQPGMVVLLTGQDDKTTNGAYYVSQDMWVRANRLVPEDERGTFYRVLSGENAGLYVCTTTAAITYGATKLSYQKCNVQWSGSVGTGYGLMRPFQNSDSEFTVSGPAIAANSPSLSLSDIRVWSRPKTAAEFTAVNFPAIVPTATAGVPTFFLSTAGSYTSFHVVPAGYAFPSVRPVDFVLDSTARVASYSASGEYVGQSSRELVGYGDAKLPPPNVTLGLAGPQLTSQGTGLASSTTGLVGFNSFWYADVTAGHYRRVTSGVSSLVANPASSYHPAELPSTNTAKARVYVKGEDGQIYAVMPSVTLAGASLTAELADSAAPTYADLYQPDFDSDAETLLDRAGVGRLGVSIASGAPQVTKLSSLGISTPPLYLYSSTVEYMNYHFPADNDSWMNLESLDVSGNLPARSTAGPLTFEGVSTPIVPGKYHVILDASVTQTPTGYAGTEVEVSLAAIPAGDITSPGSVVVPATLAIGGNLHFYAVYGGARSTKLTDGCSVAECQAALDTLDTAGSMSVTGATGGPFTVEFLTDGSKDLLQFSSKQVSVTAKRLVAGGSGVHEVQLVTVHRPLTVVEIPITAQIQTTGGRSWQVQVYLATPTGATLQIHQVTLLQLSTRLYRIDPSPSGLAVTEQALDFSTAGGFRVTAASNGDITTVHEAVPADVAEAPAALRLTGSTVDRQSSVISATDDQAPDPADPAGPAPITLLMYVDSVLPGVAGGLSDTGSDLNLDGTPNPDQPPLAPVS